MYNIHGTMKLNEYKKHIIKIVEERGVAASNEDSTINVILSYIQHKISESGERFGKEIEFTIPSDILSQFAFLHDPLIQVRNSDITRHAVIFKNGSGSCTVDTNNMKIYNDRLCNVIIDIHTYSVMNKLVDKTCLNTLYHELNHLYDIFQNYKKNSNLERYTKDVKRTTFPQNINCEKYWREAFYRLFSNTELNALIASVYGDLKGIHSQRCNFHNDYKTTLAYKAYKFFIENLDYILSTTDDESIYVIIEQMRNNCCCNLTKKDGTADYYRYLLKKIIVKRCTAILKGIGKAASLYYDRIEDCGEKIINCDYGDEIYNQKFGN